MALELTAEQRRIVARAQGGESFAVRAYAGTGKTTTLRMIGRALASGRAFGADGGRVLYLAFNREIVEKAREQRLFPANTDVITAHAFAKQRLAQMRPAFRFGMQFPAYAQVIRTTLGVRDETSEHAKRAERIRESIAEFLFSDATTFAQKDADGELARAIIGQFLERREINETDHDLYAKIFYLVQHRDKHPDLGYGVILYDECQDCTAAMFKTVRKQRAQQIYVGDPFQSIYGFRGARNAFRELEDLPQEHLTKSFRFGQSIADLAYLVVQSMGIRDREELPPIVGDPERTSTVLAGDEGRSRPTVVLARENRTLVELAAREAERGRTVALSDRNQQSLRRVAERVEAIAAFRDRGATSDPELAWYDSFEKMPAYTKRLRPESRIALRLVTAGGDPGAKARGLAERIRERGEADVLFSTVHSFKGDEGERVLLAGDLRGYSEGAETRRDGSRAPRIDEDALRLLYVAITRARSELDIRAVLRVLTASVTNVEGSDRRLALALGLRKRVRTGSVLEAAASAVVRAVRAEAPAAKAVRELAAAVARLERARGRTCAEARAEDTVEIAGTLVEVLMVGRGARLFIDDGAVIRHFPVDGSTARGAMSLRGASVRACGVREGWTVRTNAAGR
jgi:superfamily I DNA/RNA helicase